MSRLKQLWPLRHIVIGVAGGVYLAMSLVLNLYSPAFGIALIVLGAYAVVDGHVR